jgi:hypothetical protein
MVSAPAFYGFLTELKPAGPTIEQPGGLHNLEIIKFSKKVPPKFKRYGDEDHILKKRTLSRQRVP